MRSLFSLILFCLVFCFAQGQKPDSTKRSFSHARPSLRLSYPGHKGWQPGLSIGLEQPIKERQKIKEKKNGKIKTKYRFWFLTADAGFWQHPNSYTAPFVRAGVLWRRVGNRGTKYEAALYVGAVNRFNAGRTYSVKEDGSVKTSFWDARLYFMPTLAFGFGKDYLYARKPKSFAWHIRPNFSLWMPYNSSIVPTSGVELGVSIYLDNFHPLNLFRRK